MLSANQIAFKEWAVVCAALAAGRQTIILRKGGIDEGREGFHVAHHEFWLLPTRFHQDPAQLTSDAQPLWQQVRDQPLRPGEFSIDLYAMVHKVFEVREMAALQRIADQHILSAETIEQRFHYRHPGLFVLAVRIHRIPQPHEVGDSPYIAGCKSWVELPGAISTAGATAVLDDTAFDARIGAIANALITAE
jgi:hypothetical protein